MNSNLFKTVLVLIFTLTIVQNIVGQKRGNHTETYAFVNVNLISMERQEVLAGQTIIVEGDKITNIDDAGKIEIPEHAFVIEGNGKYLLPGLTDSHVHLDTLIKARKYFGDAPMFLANGVTTVFNLRGEEYHLEWKRMIEEGKLLAPNLYSSGEFIQEPRVNNKSEIKTEIDRQKNAGYDMLKHRQIVGPNPTTKWLPLEEYLYINDYARTVDIPLVGHGPYNLGIDALLKARQSLAHLNELHPLYFFNVSLDDFIFYGVRAFLLLSGIGLLWIILAVIQKFIQKRKNESSEKPSGIAKLSGVILFIDILLIAAGFFLLPGGLFFGEIWMLALLVIMSLAMMILSIKIVIISFGKKNQRIKLFAKIPAVIWGVVSFIVAAIVLIQWVPLFYRSSDSGIESIAERCAEAGIYIQSTIYIQDFMTGGPGKIVSVKEDPHYKYISPTLRSAWSRITKALPDWLTFLQQNYSQFLKKVTYEMHRAGVPIMAGTDVLGVPLFVPGASLHEEFKLLNESGLTPYEVIKSATILPAKFLGKENEYSTVTIGKRADLLLVNDNPLDNISNLRNITGVMVRGKWLSKQTLDGMLNGILDKE